MAIVPTGDRRGRMTDIGPLIDSMIRRALAELDADTDRLPPLTDEQRAAYEARFRNNFTPRSLKDQGQTDARKEV